MALLAGLHVLVMTTAALAAVVAVCLIAGALVILLTGLLLLFRAPGEFSWVP